MKFLLDTDTFSVAAREGSPNLRQRVDLVPPDDIMLSVITVGEIEFGLAKRVPKARIAARISAMREAFKTLLLDEDVARIYGQLRQTLQSKGTPIGPNDIWIAAHALSRGLTLVTNNEREFRRIPGLRVENWLR